MGANPGNSALLNMTPRSSPRVLIAQTPDPLSAANEQYPPSFRPSLGEIQAHLFRKTATRLASTLTRASTHTLKGHPHQGNPEASVKHNPNLSDQPSTINHQPTTKQPPTSFEPSPMAASALISPPLGGCQCSRRFYLLKH